MAQVLVIEADEAIRAALGSFLEDAGYSVVTTPNPDVAMQLLRSASGRMIVLFDTGVPRVSEGKVTALTSIDDEQLSRHAYICMTTSAALMHPDLHATLVSLSVPIVEKPFDLDALLRTVDQAAHTVAAQ